MKVSSEYRIDNILTLKEILKNVDQNDKNWIAFARLQRSDMKMQALNVYELLELFSDQGKCGAIYIIQQWVKNHSKTNEQYYVEYKQEAQNMPLSYKFYKRSNIELKHNNKAQMFRLFDNNLNQKLQKLAKQFVDFFEDAYKIKIRKAVCKFIINQFKDIIFMGVKYLFVDILKNSPYNRQELMKHYMEQNSIIKKDKVMVKQQKLLTLAQQLNATFFQDFLQDCKKNKSKITQKNFEQKKDVMPKIVYQDDREFSKQLYTKLRVEKCGGDFCHYQMLEKNKGPLAMRKNIMEEYQKHFGTKKTELENISIKLPYEISNQLILKTRQNGYDIANILLKNKIFAQSSDYHNTNEDPTSIDIQHEYPFINNNFKVLNYENQYKRIKICKNCFIIYSLASKFFDSNLKAQEKIKAQTSIRFRKVDYDLYKTQNIQIENPKDEFVKPPSKRNQFSNFNLKNTKKDIEVNRLTLGFLNYEKLKDFYVQDNQQLNTQQSQQNQFQNKKQLVLINQSEQANIRRDLANDQYLLSQITEDKKTLRKQYNDTELRRVFLQKVNEVIENDKKPHYILTQSLYYPHINFDHLRKLPLYKISSPMQPFTIQLYIESLADLSITQVQQEMGYSDFISDTEGIQFLVIDQNTAIPWQFLQNTESNNQTDDNNNQVQNEVIIFCQDFFDSFLEYREIFKNIVKKYPNKKVLMFNLPGQAYTVFSEEQTYNNVYIVEIIDLLLNTLLAQKLIQNFNDQSQLDNFKFVGIGYGGFILQSFLIFAHGNLQKIQSVLMINSFLEIDNILKDTLVKSLEVFQTCPENMSELPYNYFSVIVNSQQLKQEQLDYKMAINPILIKGRIVIIKGCLDSYFMKDRFQKLPIQCVIVHTLKNCVVNINQSDQLAKLSQEDAVFDKKKNKRQTVYINGGHSLIEENQDQLKEILNKFMQNLF